jgi:AcrR family transcriptional regulator
VARDLLESEGSEGLTMRRLADQLGIRAPSLYKHFPHKEALEVAIIGGDLRVSVRRRNHRYWEFPRQP